MEFTAPLVAALALLSDGLDGVGDHIGQSIRRLAADAHAAIGSFVGFTVVIGEGGQQLKFTTLTGAGTTRDAVTSIRIPMQPADPLLDNQAVLVILYASVQGAFVDLTADVSWLAGRPLHDFVLDRDLHVASEPDQLAAIHAASTLNQAIGVLIGRGRAPATAERELREHASAYRVGLETIVSRILDDPRDDAAGAGKQAQQ